MSGRKLCRICLNEVLIVLTNLYPSEVETKQLLKNIFPGMNTSLITPLHICERCFNHVNFANRLKKSFEEKQREFLRRSLINNCSRPYCGLCFRFETPPDVRFLPKDVYSSQNLKGLIEIALSSPEDVNAETNICGVCWSWIKEIYSFKRRCFKTEDILKNYCSRNNLKVMTVDNVDALVFEQYCIRNGKPFPPKQSSITIFNHIKNSDAATLQEYFELTGQVFSNLPEDRLIELENLNHIEEGDYDWLHGNKDTPHADTVPSIEVEVKHSTKIISDLDSETETDDEFDENVERGTESSDVVIILDDDDDDDDDNTKEIVFTNEDKQVVVSTFHNESDPNIVVDNDLNNIEDNLPKHFVLNHKNIKSMPSKESFTKTGDNNNNISKEVTDNNSIVLNVECSEINIACSSKSKEQHKSSTHGDKNEVRENLNHVEKNIPELIYCGTPQFSKIYQTFVNQTIEPDCQTKENITRSYNRVFANVELDIIPDQNTRESTLINPCSPSEENDSQFSDIGDISTSYLSNTVDRRPEIFEKYQSEDNVILIDEDCFEVNNQINLFNVDSYVKEMNAEEKRKKRAGFQKIKIWGCHVCIAKFRNRKQATRHMLFHEELCNKYGQFLCSECPYRAKLKGSLTRHERLHSQAGSKNFSGSATTFSCPYCSNICNVIGDIQAHINEHVISWNSFQCAHCMHTASKSESLRLHYLKYHGKAKDPTFSGS